MLDINTFTIIYDYLYQKCEFCKKWLEIYNKSYILMKKNTYKGIERRKVLSCRKCSNNIFSPNKS